MLLCYRFLREEKRLSRAVFNCCDGGSRTVSLKYMEWKYLPVLDKIYNFHNSTVVFTVPAQPHRCLQLFWLMRLLLSLKRVNNRSNESSQYDFCNSFLTSESPVCTALKEALLIKSSEQVACSAAFATVIMVSRLVWCLGWNHLLHRVTQYKEEQSVLTGCRRSLQWTSSPLPYCTASGQEPLELKVKENIG